MQMSSAYPYVEKHYFKRLTRESLLTLKRECLYERENRKVVGLH